MRHQHLSRSKAMPRAEEMLERVGIPDPHRRLREYPHQISGGMRQRALIAMALASAPRLLIARSEERRVGKECRSRRSRGAESTKTLRLESRVSRVQLE